MKDSELKPCPVCNGVDLSSLGMKCRICNGTGKVENFLYQYNKIKKQKKNITINIICKGIHPIPDEARKCPVCGYYAQHYSLEDKYEAPHLRCQQAIIDKDYFIQKYPTFTCKECQTIWQYIGEKEENKDKTE